MRTEEKDLTSEVQEKINYLSKIVKDHERGFVTFDGNSFGVQELNKRNIQKIYTDDEIYALRNHSYKSESNYISAFDSGIVNNKYSRQTLPLMHTIQVGTIEKSETSNIIFHKLIDDVLYIVLSNGVLKIINIKTLHDILELNIGFIISNKLITSGFELTSITDIIKYKSGLLISFKANGVIFISLDKSIEHEIFAPDKGIIGLHTNGTSVLTIRSKISNNVVVLSEKGLKTRIFNQLENAQQEILDFDHDENSLVVLSDNLSYLHSDHVIHKWIDDEGKISWINQDSTIPANLRSPTNQLRFIRLTKDDKGSQIINILTLNKEGKIIFWQYADVVSMLTTDIELSYDDLLDFKVFDNLYYVLTKSRIFIFNKINGKLLLFYNLKLSKDITAGSIASLNQIFGVYENKAHIYNIPEFVITKTVEIDISSLYGSNNADIYIAATDDIVVKFYSASGSEIIPNFYLKGRNEHIINILNVEKGSLLKIENIPEKSFIYSVVLHKNNYILK